MKITLNGETTEVKERATVLDVVHSLVASERGVAVSVDREIVPRSQWSASALREGALVEVLAASSGG